MVVVASSLLQGLLCKETRRQGKLLGMTSVRILSCLEDSQLLSWFLVV